MLDARTTVVVMFCQKCRTPLKLDTSLQDLNPTALKLLVEASSRPLQEPTDKAPSSRPLYTAEQKQLYDEASRASGAATFQQGAPTLRDGDHKHGRSSSSQDKNGMSYIMLTESQAGPSTPRQHKRQDESRNGSRRRSRGGSSGAETDGPLSSKMETTARLFEILSSRSDIDHPICVECTDLLIEGMEKRLANATKERDAYASFLKNANADLPTDEERLKTENELRVVQEQEAAAFAELEQLEAEKAELEQELASFELKARELDREEDAFWQERNAFSRVLSEYQDQRDSLNLRYDHDSQQLEKLSRTNVYNDTFNISHDKDGFGTINGLRLGRSSKRSVDWAEINAAWGQALLLLFVVAEKLDFDFKGHELHPMGSCSYITKFDTSPPSQNSSKQNSTKLELYYTSDLPFTLGIMHRSFDGAMIAFLECVRQLAMHIEKITVDTDHPQKLKTTIKKDMIDDVSIKLASFSGTDQWARALKLTLYSCKWCLAYTSNRDVQRNGNG